MPALSLNSQKNLIRIARETLENFVRTGKLPGVRPEDPALWEPRPCFVTLRKGGKLRGCVGRLGTEKPLFEEVVQMTKAAASEDFRFPPLLAGELREVEIQISALSPLERIRSSGEIEVGRHGVYLQWKDRNGAFLPEVAGEMGWTADEFVKACGREKAYLPEEAWPEVTLYRFTTERIKEEQRSEE
jgi:AmmeMemoRadiSam system protein A